MIVTPNFIFISNPRTGSSFARKAIRAAYGSAWSDSDSRTRAHELILPVRRGDGIAGEDHHGTVSQIPRTCRGRPVFAAVRNPFTHLVSTFELGIWRNRAGLEGAGCRNLEPFLDMWALAARVRWGIPTNGGNGPLSLHFVQMFAADAAAAFAAISGGASPREIGGHIAPILFLRQEQLARELEAALSPFLTPSQRERLARARPTHVTARSRPWSAAMISAELRQMVAEREALIFAILAARGQDLERLPQLS
jgi:hypothetical protein